MQRNNHWSAETTRELFNLAEQARTQGKSLSEVYRVIAKKTSLSEGSVRNYYYSQLHTLEMLPEMTKALGINLCPVGREYMTFSAEDAEQLVRDILKERANGKSVRTIVDQMAGGDAKLALRYQNKYRTLVFKQRPRTEKIIEKMIEEGETFFHPYEDYVCEHGCAKPSSSPKSAVRALSRALGHKKADELLRALAHAAGRDNRRLEDFVKELTDADFDAERR